MNTLAVARANSGIARELVGLLGRHWKLSVKLARREVGERYAGQMLGPAWILLHPLLLMGIYLLVFTFIFRVRVAPRGDIPVDYAVYLLSGLIPWITFQESMAKGSVSIVSNANLVKQVVFPIEILAVKGVLVSLLSATFSFSLLGLYWLIRFHSIPATFTLIPVLLVLQGVGMLGIAFMLGPIGAYFRDLKDLVQVFGLVGPYLMPALYTPEMVPAQLRPLLYLNPFSYMVWCYQDAACFGSFTHPWAWAIFPALCLLALGAGYRVFRMLRSYLGNVL